MKKIILSLVAIFAYAASISAQIIITDYEFLPTIPAPFIYNHCTYIYHENDGVIDLYDLNLNKVETVTIDEEDYWEIDIIKSINGDGYDYDHSGGEIHITQTLFDDDADWEYMVPIWDTVTDEYGTHEEAIGITVKKTDGTILGSFSIDKWGLDVVIINNVIFPFTEVHNSDYSGYTRYYYTLPEFRKFLFDDLNNVKPVPALTSTANKETYDLAGRKVSDSTRGLVIKEGKKMINK